MPLHPVHIYPDRSKYRLRWWQGWAPAVFIFVLVGCLIYATGLARHANADVMSLRGQLAIHRAVSEHWTTERDRLEAEINRLLLMVPTERIVVEPCAPKTHEQKRETPVFSRDSQFSGVK